MFSTLLLPPPANSFVIGTVVINTHNTPLYHGHTVNYLKYTTFRTRPCVVSTPDVYLYNVNGHIYSAPVWTRESEMDFGFRTHFSKFLTSHHCPPPPPHSFIIGPAVINTHTAIEGATSCPVLPSWIYKHAPAQALNTYTTATNKLFQSSTVNTDKSEIMESDDRIKAGNYVDDNAINKIWRKLKIRCSRYLTTPKKQPTTSQSSSPWWEYKQTYRNHS